MMKQYFEDLISGIENTIRENPESKTPRKMYALEIAKLGKRLYDGENTVAWCGISAPFDLLSAMGVTSCFVEFVGAMLSSSGIEGEFLEASEHTGYAGDACGYHRAVMGAAIRGIMPAPDMLIATTCPCSGGLAVIENLAAHYKKDLFVLNVPKEESGESVRYLAGQLKRMVKFVEERTGKPLDEDRLREVVDNTNKTRKAMEEMYRHAMHVPSPVSGKMLGNCGIALPLLFGRPETVEVAELFRDAFAEKIANNEPGVPGERHRLLWIQNRIQFKNPVIEILEKDYQAAIVSDECNLVNWDEVDPDDVYTSMARRALSIPFNGKAERRLKIMKQLAEDYKIDGAVNPCNWGCRQGAGLRGLVGHELKEIGIPVLNLEVDCVDSRNFMEGQIRTRLEAFMEMLDSQPSPWA